MTAYYLLMQDINGDHQLVMTREDADQAEQFTTIETARSHAVELLEEDELLEHETAGALRVSILSEVEVVDRSLMDMSRIAKIRKKGTNKMKTKSTDAGSAVHTNKELIAKLSALPEDAKIEFKELIAKLSMLPEDAKIAVEFRQDAGLNLSAQLAADRQARGAGKELDIVSELNGKEKAMKSTDIVSAAKKAVYKMGGKLGKYRKGRRVGEMRANGVASHILSNVESYLLGLPPNPTQTKNSSTDGVFEASDADDIKL